MSGNNNFPFSKASGQSTEIDYGDIPENMNEQDMRAYLALESKLVMPNQKKRDSFEKQWTDGRQKYNTQNNNNNSPNYQNQATTNSNMQFAFQQNQQQRQQPNNGYRPQPNYKNTVSSTTSRTTVNTNSTTSAYPPEDYHDNVVDRMSTVTIISQKGKHRREHSFKKQQVPSNNNAYNQPPMQQQQQQQGNNANLPPINQNNTKNQTAQFPYNANMNIGPNNNNNNRNGQQYNNQQYNQRNQQYNQQYNNQYNNNNNQNNPHNQQYNNQQYNGYNNNARAPPKSALTAQIAPQKAHLANQHSGQQSGVIQSRNAEGKLVVKQMPYSKKTHVCVNIFVEIKPEHIEHIIVYFLKHFSVKQFLDLLKNETNNAAFKDAELQIFCADDDGDLDDDFPAPEPNAMIAKLGLKNFYIKLRNVNDEQRDNIRRSTLSLKGQLLSTEEIDKMHSLDEDYDDDDAESDDEYEDDEGCKCIIL